MLLTVSDLSVAVKTRNPGIGGGRPPKEPEYNGEKLCEKKRNYVKSQD